MNTNKDDFMAEAIQIAVESVKSGKGGPFGVVIVKDDKIIARGTNQVTSTNDPTAHAEVVAIRNACRELKDFQLEDCEIFTSCEPCPMCLGAIYWARPKKLYFAATKDDAAKAGFDDLFIYKEIDMPYEKRSIPFEHLAHKETQAPFKAWEGFEDKIEY